MRPARVGRTIDLGATDHRDRRRPCRRWAAISAKKPEQHRATARLDARTREGRVTRNMLVFVQRRQWLADRGEGLAAHHNRFAERQAAEGLEVRWRQGKRPARPMTPFSSCNDEGDDDVRHGASPSRWGFLPELQSAVLLNGNFLDRLKLPLQSR